MAEHFRPRDACVPASLTLPPTPRPSPKPSPPLQLIRRHPPPMSPLGEPQIPHGSPTFAGRCQKCAPLRQPSFQRRTRRARHLASWFLARDHILPDLGFIVYRITQDSFVCSLPLFRSRTPAAPLLPSFSTQPSDTLPLLAVAYLYLTTLASLDQGRDRSRTLMMQYTLYPSRSRAVATIPFACSRLFLRDHSLPLYSLSSPSPLYFPSRIANLPRISRITLRTHIAWSCLPRYSTSRNSSRILMD